MARIYHTWHGYAPDTFTNTKSLSLSSGVYVNANQTVVFGNGVSDSAFSIFAWLKPSSYASRTVMSAASNSSNAEWLFAFDGASKLRLQLYDGSSSNNIRRLANVATSGSGWQFFCATYDGSSSSAGITLYDGSGPLASTGFSAGSYVAMNGAMVATAIGFNGIVSWPYAGLIDHVGIVNSELSAAQVAAVASGPTSVPSAAHLWEFEDNLTDTVSSVNAIPVGGSVAYSTDVP